jgi:hypothetical protein
MTRSCAELCTRSDWTFLTLSSLMPPPKASKPRKGKSERQRGKVSRTSRGDAAPVPDEAPHPGSIGSPPVHALSRSERDDRHDGLAVNFQTLPDDVLGQILPLLDLKELLSVREVSRESNLRVSRGSDGKI